MASVQLSSLDGNRSPPNPILPPPLEQNSSLKGNNYNGSNGSSSSNSLSHHLSRSLSFAAGHHGFKGATASSAVFNLTTTVIGAGIMGLPATVKSMGIPLAFVVLVAMGLLTQISIEMLIKTATVQQAWSYSDLVLKEFGNKWRIVLDVAVILGLFGMCIVYLIIVADVFSGTFSGSGAHHEGILVEWNGGQQAWWNSRYFVIFILMTLVLAPLSALKHVDSLHYSSAVSVLLAVIFVAITVVIFFINLFEGKINSPQWYPDLSSGEAVALMCSVIPVIATAYVCHFNVLPIYVELKDRTEQTMTKVARISLAFSTVIYTVTALAGYLLFTSDTASDVLVNFDHSLGSVNSSALNDFIRITYALHIILVFPVIFYALRETTDNVLFANKEPLIDDDRRFFAITAVEMVVSYVGAVLIPNVWMAFSLTGATSTMILGMIFPAALAISDKSGVIALWEKKVAYFMIGLSVVVSLSSLASNVYFLAVGDAGAPGSSTTNVTN